MPNLLSTYLALLSIFLLNAHVHAQTKTPQVIQREIQGQIYAAKKGDTIKLPEGRLALIRSLSISGQSGITFLGKGKNKTILTFATQEEGLEGLKVFNCQDIRLEGFSIEDSWGDALIVQNVEGITIKNVKTSWPKNSGKKKNDHGIIAIKSNRLMLDSCEASGALNAGIFVKQSRNLIIKDAHVSLNVTGISVVNSSNIEIHHSLIEQNSLGITLENLPGLLVMGEGAKIYKNQINNNGLKNFSPSTYFSHSFPEGSGLIVMAYHKAEIYENEIVNNKAIGAFVLSFLSAKLDGGHPEDIAESFVISQDRAAYSFERDSLFNPYSTSIIFTKTLFIVKSKRQVHPIFMQIFSIIISKKSFPSIVYDGIFDSNIKQDKPHLCLQNNRNATL